MVTVASGPHDCAGRARTQHFVRGGRVIKFQLKDYYCGPASLQNALLALGRRQSQDRIATIAGTTEADGTDENGILRTALWAGLAPDQGRFDAGLAAHGWVWSSLTMGRPVLLCVDRWQHWVTAVGVLGQRVVLFDPARYPHNKARNGVFTLPRAKLLKRWAAARSVRGKGPVYYGIALGLDRVL